MGLNWKDIHLTNENIYNGNLSRHREPQWDCVRQSQYDWDFSHLNGIIEALLMKWPDHDVYLYGSVESAYDNTHPSSWAIDTSSVANGNQAPQLKQVYDNQTPIIVAIALPTGRVPTCTVGYKSNQTNEEIINSFDDLNYAWTRADDPFCSNRVYYLTCGTDISVVPNEQSDEFYVHEYTSLFIPSPHEFARRADGSFKVTVDSATFNFTDENGNEVDEGWTRSEDGSRRDYVDQLVEDYFDNASDEEKARARENIIRVMDTRFQEIRAMKQQQINMFFEPLNWNEEGLRDLKLCKIVPVNFPSKITNKCPDRYVDRLVNHLPEQMKLLSNHASISGAGLVHQVPRNVFAGFNVEDEPPLTTVLLCSCLLVDFLRCTFFMDKLIGLSFDTPVIYDRVVSTFGIDRVLQYLGLNPNAFVKDKCIAFLRDVVFIKVEKAFSRAGRLPDSARDFLFNFIWEPHSSPLTESNNRVAECIRFSRANSERSSRRRNPDFGSLQVRFVGDSVFLPINPSSLGKLVSKDAFQVLLLELLSNPRGQIVAIPAGARDDDNEDEEAEPSDCLKGAILLAPDSMLSPMGKQRVKETFPTHEINLSHVRSLLEDKVKTIALKQIKSNVHHHAMTSNDVMVGVFYDKLRKHCVLIDGSDGVGSISDPVEGFGKGLVRSARSLRKLGVSQFRELYVLRRFELSHKSRRGLEKRTRLPFLPSLG